MVPWTPVFVECVLRGWRCAVALACLAWSVGAWAVPVREGAPTVVFQAGLASDKSVWRAVLNALEPHVATLALDRPGHGAEPDTQAPRDACTVAREQRAQLQRAGVKPPYVLVGHSLGGTYQFAYAKLFPEEVAGLVLVDATPPGHWVRMQAEAPAQAALVKVMRSVAFSAVDRREFDAQADCFDQLGLDQPLKVPTKVLVAGRFRAEEKGAFEAMMLRSRPHWLALTGATALEVVWDAGHLIPIDCPEDVAEAVLALAGQPEVRIALPAVPAKDALPVAPGATRAQVLERLGQPTETLTAAEAEVWVYNHRVEVPALLGFLPVVGDAIDLLDWAQRQRHSHEVVVQFDAQGVVKRIKRRALE